MLGESDDVQLGFASERDLVLVGYNVADYRRLHGEWLRIGRHHAGIAMAVQQRYSEFLSRWS
jgi:hypothetical protein